jgi:hypothetical protein
MDAIGPLDEGTLQPLSLQQASLPNSPPPNNDNLMEPGSHRMDSGSTLQHQCSDGAPGAKPAAASSQQLQMKVHHPVNNRPSPRSHQMAATRASEPDVEPKTLSQGG